MRSPPSATTQVGNLRYSRLGSLRYDGTDNFGMHRKATRFEFEQLPSLTLASDCISKMKLAAILRSFMATSESPELGPGPRPGVDGLAPLTEKLDQALADAKMAGTQPDLIRATVLLWHDHLDAAHALAQEVETRDGSYVHAILHRREPDYDNAKYWFRRVGQHPCFAKLAEGSKALLKTAGREALEKTLIPVGDWDAFAFVTACESVSKRPADDSQVRLLREVQRIEFEVLLEHLVRVQS